MERFIRVQAVYIHKLCVKREYAHRNMTRLVMEAIKEECRKNGIKYIRLDTGLDEKSCKKNLFECWIQDCGYY